MKNIIMTLPLYKPGVLLPSGNMFDIESYKKYMNSEGIKERIKQKTLLLSFFDINSGANSISQFDNNIPMVEYFKTPPNDINKFPEYVLSNIKKRRDSLVSRLDLNNLNNIIGNVVSWEFGSFTVNVWDSSICDLLIELMNNNKFAFAHSGIIYTENFTIKNDPTEKIRYLHNLEYLTCFIVDSQYFREEIFK